MGRYFLEIAFDGSDYHGWQVQENAVTVQATVDHALKTIFSDPQIQTVGCGRTDTGVHASQFFIHFDTDQELDNVVHKLNSFFPDDIVCLNFGAVQETWHARFDAISRTYRYVIRRSRSPFNRGYSWMYVGPLNVSKMNEACNFLLGEQDFSCFSKSHTQTKTNICKINFARWIENEEELVFEINANRFLRNMVRAIVGTLMEVGKENIEPTGLIEIIKSKNRSEAGQSAPAQGLFLSKIEYPDNE